MLGKTPRSKKPSKIPSMASLILRHRSPSLIHIPNQSLITFSHLYSSSSNNDNDGNSPPDFSSYFSKIKNQQQSSPNFNFTPQSSKGASFEEIRKNLSEFRRRSLDSPIPGNAKSMPNSGQNFNNKNVGDPNPSFSKGGTLSFDKIRESLQKMRENKVNNVNEQLSLNNYKQSFRMKPASDRGSNSKAETGSPSRVIGGTIGSLPSATFGDEIKEKDGTDLGASESKKFELFKHYTHAELGEKLKDLRPDTSTLSKNMKKGKGAADEGWFSLSELQQRLGKLNEIEQKQSAKTIGGLAIGDLRKGLKEIELSKEKPKALNFDLLTQESSMSPKEHLIEKYFHPDNMSSAEKLEIELKKVRDEFKMSESDCGSTRVQIAQLTTEIHHLSSVLHKKDKHSRRGLLAKVQQRKKLLKYLRRTDWDSYCFVLSKLGLRDNPDYKN